LRTGEGEMASQMPIKARVPNKATKNSTLGVVQYIQEMDSAIDCHMA
jgi:hypothetical protein